MTWNYRMVRKVVDGVESYGIHEVYYDDDGVPNMCTEDPCSPFGETHDELLSDMKKFSEAVEKEVLDWDSFN